MVSSPDDIQLKFDGESVRRLDGAPAEAVIASLNALQRMVLIIGMRSEGYGLGQRFKPSAKVRREYALICRAPKDGSHIQPFNVAAQSGAFTPGAAAARERLLGSLKAFDSEDEGRVLEVIPNARERWFMADAASGLLPAEGSGIEVTVRAGSHGPFAFKADRARALISKYRAGAPPEAEEEVVAGKLHTIDYNRTIITLKPSNSRAIRFDYPLKLEKWFQENVRRRIRVLGDPTVNQLGDVTSFRKINTLTELEPTLPAITDFAVGNVVIKATRPLAIPVTLEFEDRLFVYRDRALGVDVFDEKYDNLRDAIIEELKMLWEQYARAPDNELDAEALDVKRSLNARFKETTNDA